MKDSEVRGLILGDLYERRHQGSFVKIPDDLSLDVDPMVVGNVALQLHDLGLIQFHQIVDKKYPSGSARIQSRGVDVVEGNAPAPVSITIDSSVNVHGSQNVQVGGSGNVQTVT